MDQSRGSQQATDDWHGPYGTHSASLLLLDVLTEIG